MTVDVNSDLHHADSEAVGEPMAIVAPRRVVMEAAGADAAACGGCVVSSGALAGSAVVSERGAMGAVRWTGARHKRWGRRR